jgi:hypothetical protein
VSGPVFVYDFKVLANFINLARGLYVLLDRLVLSAGYLYDSGSMNDATA